MQSNAEPGASSLRQRIESLSDLVFGLALSVGSIILISQAVSTPFDLVKNIVLFGFSFLIIIWIWSGYTRTTLLLPVEVQQTFLLNIVLLFCVAIEPYLFYELFVNSPLANFASAVYAVNAAAMMLILAGLSRIVIVEEKRVRRNKLSPARLSRLGRIMSSEIIAGAIFLFSALPFTWIMDPAKFSYVRFDLWDLTFVVFFFISGGRFRPKETQDLDPTASPPSPQPDTV